MYPRVLSGFGLESQTPEPPQFVFQISEMYLKGNVVNGRGRLRPTRDSRGSVSGRAGRALECDRRSPVCNLEERAV